MKPLVKNPPAAVYRHINASGETIYIGCSINPMARFVTHRTQSPWATDVHRIDIAWFDSQEAALAEEQRLIMAERPIHNRQAHRGKREWATNAGVKYLQAWMDNSGFSIADVSNAMGEPLAVTRGLLNERGRPQSRRRTRLAVVTAGYVPPRTWLPYAVSEYSPVSQQEAASELAEAIEMLGYWKIPIPSPIQPRRPRSGKSAAEVRG